MDNNALNCIITDRITALKNKREYHLNAAGFCSAKIEELEALQVVIDKTTKEIKNQNIKEYIHKNTLKSVLVEPDDAKRVNAFLEFMDKCGEEKNYMRCRSKMPKLESLLYRKNRLWYSWKEFLEDYDMWIKREGHWSKVLVKEEDDK